MTQTASSKKIREVLVNPDKGRRLVGHMWRHFKEDRCTDEAASLSYTSLLSLVPLLAVVFGIASAFPVFEEWSQQFKEFMYTNMVPAAGDQFEETIEQFLQSVNKLTLTGTFFLIVTALLLMMRIEKSFNLIWRVPASRPLVNKITMYWAVLTLGPMALGAATALSAQPLIELLGGEVLDAGLMRLIGVFLLTWVAFGLMFLLVPHCKVPIPYAAIGALVSTVLFTVAKSVFLGYVSQASYSVIYGAMASVPIFLFWLYLVWIAILLGASLAASLTTFSDRGTDWKWPAAWEFMLVYRLMGHFYEAQKHGEALTVEQLLELEPGFPASRLQLILAKLLEQKMLMLNQNDGYALARDLSSFSLKDLYSTGDYHLPIGKEFPVPTTRSWDKPFLSLLNSSQLDMDRSLASMYDQTAKEST